jgi:hypothetical protein
MSSFYVSYSGVDSNGGLVIGSMDIVGSGIHSYEDSNTVSDLIQYAKDLPRPPTILFWRAYDAPAPQAPTTNLRGESSG